MTDCRVRKREEKNERRKRKKLGNVRDGQKGGLAEGEREKKRRKVRENERRIE